MEKSNEVSPKTINQEVKKRAEAILERALRSADASSPEQGVLLDEWRKRAEEVWALRYKAAPILLGTALLARAMWEDSDPLSLKLIKDNPRTYSARSLAHNVFLPFATRYGLALKGVGREPLNNQPFFRYDSVKEIERAKYLEDITRLQRILDEVDELSAEGATVALSAFFQFSRAREGSEGGAPLFEGGDTGPTLPDLAGSVEDLISQFPEGGKSAQAVAAAGIKTIYPYSQVQVLSRVNDPGRHHPGDVALVGALGAVVLAVEARGKPVTPEDALVFARQVAEKGVRKALILDLHGNLERLSFNPDALQRYGVTLMEVRGASLFTYLAVELSPLSQEDAVRLFLSKLFSGLQDLGAREGAKRLLVGRLDLLERP